jgi:hypothetical protein
MGISSRDHLESRLGDQAVFLWLAALICRAGKMPIPDL